MGSLTRWLDVEVGSSEVDLNTLPCSLVLLDLHNDNDFKLIVGDLGRDEESPKLKVFKGTMLISDMVLPDLPLGVVGFYTSETTPHTVPVVAVAFSSCIYIYRNMKLFYKYYLPSIDLSISETEIWTQLTDPLNHDLEKIKQITDKFNALPQKVLSLQTRNFLTLSMDERLEYLENNGGVPMKRVPEVVCISTLKMNSVNKHYVSCLIVGSEDGDIFILDPHTFTHLNEAKLCAVKKTPYRIVATGQYNVEYRITVATREKSVCVLKREWSEGRLLFSTEEHIVAIEVMVADNSIMVICADNTLAYYSKKGRKQWCLNLEHRPVAMTLVTVTHLGVTLTAVALASGHVYLYDGKICVDTLFIKDVVSVIKFGQLGQEEHVLAIVTSCGNLMLKILKRTADFNAHAAGLDISSSAAISQKPWMIPKKSKLFLEQSMRERENAIPMHVLFQQDLNRLRLMAAKTLLDVHVKSDNSVGIGSMENVRLSAEVEGLGPVFRVTLIIENKSTEKAVIGLSILFHVHTMYYKVSHPYIKVPLLSPGGKLHFPTKVEEVFDDNINPDVIFRPVTGEGTERTLVKVLLLKEGKKQPVLAATVQMPPTDPMMLPLDKIEAVSGYHNHAVGWDSN